jgi:fido (protein-threonine AMPylation protein)
MPLTPGYGDTPLPDDELEALLPHIADLLERPISKAAIYDLEQGVQVQVAEGLLTLVLDGTLGLDELVNDYFLRDVHARLYADIWTWAGVWRTHELNIGMAPEQVAVELRSSLDTIRYRWEHTTDWTARELGIVVHAETVRIHPFTDGNGRTTRLLADLVFTAAQDAVPLQQYDWNVDKGRYIALLREFDRHRSVGELADFIPVRLIEA